MRFIPTPVWTNEQLEEFFDATMEQALSYGLTSIHDAWTTPEQIAFFRKYVNTSLPLQFLSSTCQPKEGRSGYIACTSVTLFFELLNPKLS